MRKWRLLSALLAVLAAAGLLVSALWVSASGHDVTFAETLLEGEAADFQGIEITARAQLGWDVLWETALRPGTNRAQQTHRTYAVPVSPESDIPEPCISVSMGVFYGAQTEMDESALRHGADRIAEQAPDGAAGQSGTISARDMSETLPLHFAWGSSYPTETAELRPFFQIPTPEDWTVSIGIVFADPANHSLGYGIEAVEPNGGSWPALTVCSAGLNSDAGPQIYFTLDCSLPNGGALDLSAVEQGGGIYCYRPTHDTIQTVYPFPPETRVHALWLSADHETLYLIRTLGEETTLTVLSVPEMAERQIIALPFAAPAQLLEPICQENTLLIPEASGALFVLTAGDDGHLTPEMLIHTADDPAFQPAAGQPWEDTLRYCAAFAGGRGRFAVAVPVFSATEEEPLDFLLSVYDAAGRRGTMLLESSLTPDNVPEYTAYGPPDHRALHPPGPMLSIALD